MKWPRVGLRVRLRTLLIGIAVLAPLLAALAEVHRAMESWQAFYFPEAPAIRGADGVAPRGTLAP